MRRTAAKHTRGDQSVSLSIRLSGSGIRPAVLSAGCLPAEGPRGVPGIVGQRGERRTYGILRARVSHYPACRELRPGIQGKETLSDLRNPAVSSSHLLKRIVTLLKNIQALLTLL